MDDWEYLDEVNVMDLWPSTMKEAVTSTKWSERRDALQALLELCEKHPRLYSKTTTVYGQIIDELKKILLKDSNINVVGVAIRVITALARGLRRNFGSFVGMVWSPLIEKAKDKKATVREPLPACLDAVAATCSIDRISGPLLEGMVKPSPEMKTLLDGFIYRFLLTIPSASSALPFIKDITPILVKHASDPDATVRDCACTAIGGIRRLLGGALDTLLGPLNSEQPKMAKIAAACEKATQEVAEAEEARRAASGVERVDGGGDGGCGTSIGDSEENGGQSADSQGSIDPWTLLDAVEITSIMDSSFYTKLAEKKWQERKEALEGLEKSLKEKGRVAPSGDISTLVSTITKVLEKDVNINVAALAASCLTLLATALRTDFASYTPKVIACCCEKLKEKKAVVRDRVVECMDAVALTVSVESYTEELLGGLAKANPSSRSQTAIFISRLFSQHSSHTLPKDAAKALAPGLIKLSSDSDSECRDAAFSALAALLRCVGEAAGRVLLGEVYEDKIKMTKIEKIRDDLIAEKGAGTASEGIIRLHGGGKKTAPSGGRKSEESSGTVEKKTNNTVPPRPSSRPSTARSSLGVSHKPPSTAPIRVSSSTGVRPSQPLTAKTTINKNNVSAPPSTRSTPRVSAPSHSKLSSSRPSSGRATPNRGLSRENLNGLGGSGPLTLDGAVFNGSDAAKEARIAENRPSTLADLLKLASHCASPPMIALLRSDDHTNQLLMCECLESLDVGSIRDHSDIVTRWLSLRLNSTSSPLSLISKLLPLTSKLLSIVDLHDVEVSIILPAVVSKIGDTTRDSVRADAMAVFLSLAESIGTPRALPYLGESLRAKGLRSKMDSLAILITLLRKDSACLAGCTTTTIKKLLPALLDCAADKDAQVRNRGLEAMVIVDGQMRDDETYKAIMAKVPMKERALITQRIQSAASGQTPTSRILAPLPHPTVSSASSTVPKPSSLIRPPSSKLPMPPTTSRIPRPGSGIPAPGMIKK